MKSILHSYLDQEIWILIRDKWYFAKIIRVWDDLLWFQHRTHNKENEEDTLWEMVVKISEVTAIDRIISVVSRKADVFISQLIETEQPKNNHHKDNEN